MKCRFHASALDIQGQRGYNINYCPVSLMDKTMDSGSINVGSIPTRGASFECRFIFKPVLYLYWSA